MNELTHTDRQAPEAPGSCPEGSGPGGSAYAGPPALAEILSAARAVLDCDAVAVLRAGAEGGSWRVEAATDPRLAGCRTGDRALSLADPVLEREIPSDGALASLFPGYRACIAAPAAEPGMIPLALAGLSAAVRDFDPGAPRILAPLARAVAQLRVEAPGRLPEDGADPAGIAHDLVLADTADETAAHYLRLTLAQKRIGTILDELLRTKPGHADSAIDRALAAIGQDCSSDRVYVFQVRDDVLIDNTHEWCAPGIAPMIDELQGLPIEIAAQWLDRFERDEAVHIPDVPGMPDDAPEKETLVMQGIKSLLAVPILEAGRFAGFIGFDAVRGYRSFLPGEISLLSSVASAIGALLYRKRVEVLMQDARLALTKERNRLLATLDALPDLVVEMNAERRFTHVHSRNKGLLNVPENRFIGNGPDEVLAAPVARTIHRLLDEADRDGIAFNPEMRQERPEGEVVCSLSASKHYPDPASREPAYVLVSRDITRDTARKRQLERLSSVAEHMTNIVILTDMDRRVTWVNGAFERRTGETLDTVVGKRPGELLQGDALDVETIAAIRAALDRGEPTVTEISSMSRSGNRFWLSLGIQPLLNGQDEQDGWVWIIEDITERKLYQQQLAAAAQQARDAEQRVVEAIETLPDAFAYYDRDDRLILCNERYLQYYPKTAPFIQPGRTFEEIIDYGLAHGEYQEAIGCEDDWKADRMHRHRQTYNESEQLLSAGRWLRIIERRTPDGGQVGLRTDITELKQLAQRAQADRLAAMDASRDGIAIIAADGRFLYMNPTHRQMFRIPAGETPAQTWIELYSSAKCDFLEKTALRALWRDGNWQGEIWSRRLDGSEFPQEISLTLREDGGILCITRDVTERLRAQQEQAKLREDLQIAQRREVIGQLAAGIAHDFNNLLAAIAGSATLIRDGQPAPANLDRILVATERATALVHRLSDLGTRTSRPSRMDFRQPVREAADLVRAGGTEDIVLRLDLPDEELGIEVDPTDVLQVVLNLVINARDAIAGDSGRKRRGKITVSLAPAGPDDLAMDFDIGSVSPAQGYYRLIVEDNGPGLTDAVRAKAFEMHFSTKGDMGTGLGLPIVAGVIGANGGALRLETTPGEGTRFIVLWPATRGPEPSAPRAVPQHDLTGRLDGRVVLVVDDNEDVLRVLSDFLENVGAEVAACPDPGDALDAIGEDPGSWDLLITDYSMPRMTGVALARAAHALVPTLPVLMITAQPDWGSRREANIGREISAVLGKPLSPEELVAAAEAAIAPPQRS